MKYLLIYSYQTNQYELKRSADLFKDSDCEILYEFEMTDLKVALKILNNLTIERETESKGRNAA